MQLRARAAQCGAELEWANDQDGQRERQVADVKKLLVEERRAQLVRRDEPEVQGSIEIVGAKPDYDRAGSQCLRL